MLPLGYNKAQWGREPYIAHYQGATKDRWTAVISLYFLLSFSTWTFNNQGHWHCLTANQRPNIATTEASGTA